LVQVAFLTMLDYVTDFLYVVDMLKQILDFLKAQDERQLADKRQSDTVQFFTAMSVVVRLYPCSRITQALKLLQL